MTLHPKPRGAFTLLELLVVIGIIVLLATLSTAAVMRVRDSQRENNTETQLRKIQMGLDQRSKATLDRIKAEPVPQAIIDLTRSANGMTDMARARALHLKLRLRSEFPQTFAECDPVRFQAASLGRTWLSSRKTPLPWLVNSRGPFGVASSRSGLASPL